MWMYCVKCDLKLSIQILQVGGKSKGERNLQLMEDFQK